MAEYRRGTGPNALPQGGAAAINAAQPAPQDILPSTTSGGGLPDGTEIPVEFGQPEDDLDTGLSENMSILTGPADPAFKSTPIQTRKGPDRVPSHIVANMPILQAAARNPESPIAMTALYRFIARRLEREMQGR